MHLFLTGVLPFLAHDHPSAVAFLTCRHHNFHASIIPEFLSDEARVRKFCQARQQDRITPLSWTDMMIQYANFYELIVQTPLMQFSPSLLIYQEDCVESILKPLLATKYFPRTLQRCVVLNCVNSGLLLGLSKVQTLTNLDLCESEVQKEHLEIIVNTFPSLETLAIGQASQVKSSSIYSKTGLFITSPLPPATKTLRCLILDRVDALFATQFASNFPNLRKLVLGVRGSSREADMQSVSSSLPLLTYLSLTFFNLNNTDSLRNLVHLSSIGFSGCRMTELNFLSQENNLPHLTTLCVDGDHGITSSSEFASLYHAPNLRVLAVNSWQFDNDCLQYLENMIHLRKLDLRGTRVGGDSRALKTLMQNLIQLEELNLHACSVGNKGAISGALYSTHSRLRVLNLGECDVVDDDLNGIGALKNTLEVLNLNINYELTNEALRHCGHLVKLKSLGLLNCTGIADLTPLKDCLNLEELDLSSCWGLTDNSFKVFSEQPNSFPNLQELTLSENEQLTEKVFDHLSNNNHLVYHLKELNFDVMPINEIFLSSATARNNLCQLKGLRRLTGFLSCFTSESETSFIEDELMRNLKNLDEIR